MKKTGLFLCLLVSALIASSCGSETDQSPASGEGSSSVPASEPESGETSSDLRYSIPEPELPELDFGGEPFTVYLGSLSTSSDNYYTESTLFPAVSFVWTENLNGEIVNDAVFNRNLAAEQRFNVKITPLVTERYPNELVMAGETSMDLVMANGWAMSKVVAEGPWMNLIGFPYLNLEAEYWSPRCLEGTVVDGIVFMMPSDFCLDPLANTGVLFFNKRILEENDLQNPYDLVHSDTWTLENFLRLVASVGRDLNGDGVMDVSDLYGGIFRTQWRLGAFMQFYFGCGEVFTKTDSEKGRVISFNPDRSQRVIEMLREVLEDRHLCLDINDIERMESNSYYETVFLDGHALFCQDFVSSLDVFREMEDDFGIVPNPKYDETQDRYYQRVVPTSTMFAIPVTVQNEEKTGAITEYLSWLSHSTVLPAFYEVTVQTKRTRDEDTIEMLDIIRASRIFEFGEIYYSWIGHYIWDSYEEGTFSKASSSEKILTKRLNKLLNQVTSAGS
ncbi:MAG: carbohydrate ABC transporter substrate-binding protein [Clostridia bacterium]|nr:carbohydrate ABC transporter substrate-binding protein [Clostridia bacterium]